MAGPQEWGDRGPPEPLTGLARVLSAGPKKECQDLRDTGLSATISQSGVLEGPGGFKEEEQAVFGRGDLGKRRQARLQERSKHTSPTEFFPKGSHSRMLALWRGKGGVLLGAHSCLPSTEHNAWHTVGSINSC